MIGAFVAAWRMGGPDTSSSSGPLDPGDPGDGRGSWEAWYMATRGCQLESAQRLRRGAGNRHVRGYDNEWGRAAKAAIAEHVRVFGWACPGFNRPGHPVEPGGLTGDHRVPRAFGGTIADGIDVLCRSCNSERGQVTRREIAALRADGQGPGALNVSRPDIPPSEPRPARFGRLHVAETGSPRSGSDLGFA